MIAVALAGWAALAWAVLLAVALRRALRARAEDVARACHELRGPLHAAGLALHAARRDGRNAAMLRAAELELDRLMLVIDELGGVHRARRPFDLAELVRCHEPAWQELAAAAGTTVSVSATAATVRGDAARVSQVLCNLVANAVEHGSGHVSVQVAVDDVQARVSVADEGPGLPVGLQLAALRPRGRRGRGLAIAAAAANALGGRLLTAPGARLVLELRATRA